MLCCRSVDRTYNKDPGCVGDKELPNIKLAFFPTALLISGKELKISPLSSDRLACCTAATHVLLSPSVGMYVTF